jgi:hypothetical protein
MSERHWFEFKYINVFIRHFASMSRGAQGKYLTEVQTQHGDVPKWRYAD